MKNLSPGMVFLVFILILIVAVMILIPIVVWSMFNLDTGDDFMTFLSNPFILLGLLLIQDMVFVGVPYYIYIKTKLLTWAELGLEDKNAFTRATQGMIVGLGYAGIVTGIVAFLGVDSSGGVPLWENMDPTEYTIIMFGGAVVAPIAEEFFFRGIAFKGVMKYLEHKGKTSAFPFAIIYSTVLFTVAHGYDLVGTAVVFVGGLIFALLFYKTGSLITPMFAHGAYNAGVITATYIGLI